MRFFISILLTLSYLALSMRPSVPVFEYLLLKSEIAEKYCINQDKPELDCEGKCYLMNRLKQVNTDDQPTPRTEIEMTVPVHIPDADRMVWIVPTVRYQHPNFGKTLYSEFIPNIDSPPPQRFS